MKWIAISALLLAASTSIERDLCAEARRAKAEGVNLAQPQPRSRVVMLGTGTPNADPDQ